ncbi:hypothetical protein [Streptomyces sp. NPDC050392]|uniref:hypothetical protein n=1 Tax=Streptomyces sp. NPDC050392 TaxID=3155782 RepID=UPI0034172F8A
MQDTEEDTSPAAATAAAQAALNGGRPADARAHAAAALERYGPDPALCLLLGRAHVVEDEDDHDDEAERVYRQGLEAFPDDLGLLSAYAELCLASDPLDHPGRHARGPVLANRIIELAPDSPQALHVGRHARGEILVLPDAGNPAPAVIAHIQRHDVRAALAAAPDLADAAWLAGEQAVRRPYDRRLAILAETLAALERPGRRLLLAHVRAPLPTLLTVAVLAATLTASRAAYHLPAWVALIAVLLFVPGAMLRRLERHARARGLARLLTPPDGAELPDSPLPPPPAFSSRELVVNLAVLVIVVCSAASPLLWTPPENTDYPHYTATAPDTLLGAPLLSAQPGVDGVGSDTVSIVPDGFGPGSFIYLYGTPQQMAENSAEPLVLVIGLTADHRNVPADTVRMYEQDLAESESTINDVWDAHPGGHGGRLRCVAYATDTEDKGAHTACSWIDRGSSGTIVLNRAGLDRDSAAAIARTTRDAILQVDTSGTTQAAALTTVTR